MASKAAPKKVRILMKDTSLLNTKKISSVRGLECRMCKKNFTSETEVANHIKADGHKFKEEYRSDRKRHFQDSVEGLVVSKIERTLEKNEADTSTLAIVNTLPTKVVFEVTQIVCLVDLKEVTPHRPNTMKIKPGEVFEYKLTARFSRYCTYEYPLVFVIRNISNASKYQLLSVCTYNVLPVEAHDLGPNSPYTPNTRNKFVQPNYIKPVPGEPILYKMKLIYKAPLDYYNIPPYFFKILQHGFKRMENDGGAYEYFKSLFFIENDTDKKLSIKAPAKSNYVERFTYLLYIEEYQENLSMMKYNRDDIVLEKNADKFNLLLPDLAEGRPSVLKGDSLLISSGNKNSKFEGVVHDVRENTVSLAFHKTFKYINNEKVTVEFQLNRMTLRICHRALNILKERNLTDFMFPREHNRDVKHVNITKFYDQKIEQNGNQKLAVKAIVSKSASPAPYIVYGPPGTGKTSTLVEAMKQLYFTYGKSATICACAPSNAAANLLTLKLIEHVPRSEVLRIFGLSYCAREVPEQLQGCSNFTSANSDLLFPSIEVIKSKKIIVVTPITAGRLYGVLGESYFDFLFMDEAGQAEETLSLVPLTGLLKRNDGKFVGSLVLAGDPKQLGPIIHSKFAIQLGLGVPLIERLMDTCQPYKKKNGVYDVNYITKLNINYRSHPILLHIPNKLFYDNELKSHANEARTRVLCAWDKLPKKNVPLIFHGVQGKDERESNSPSYFNQQEIVQVGNYLTDLLETKVNGRVVKQEEVVVLTPYRKQVHKFRVYFQKKKWTKVQVSSIEQFQGQERLVVILSCVRSRKEFLQSDYEFGLGFLRNPKRFNVAITRAIALMIVVGNPNVLQCDSNWHQLMLYCKEMGCYRGAEADGDLEMDMSGLTISTHEIPESEKPGFVKHD